MIRKLLLIILAVYPLTLFANESDDTSDNIRFGLFGHYALNTHEAEFTRLPSVPTCCPLFESAEGNGMLFGLLFEYPLNNLFNLSLRAAYSMNSTDFEAMEEQFVNNNDEVSTLEVKHLIESDMSVIRIEPLVGIRLFDLINLYAGANFDYFMAFDYDQIEKLESPANKTFENGSKTRNHYTGSLEDGKNTFLISATAGIGFDLPLNSRSSLILSPEAFYDYPLNEPLSFENEGKWKFNAIRFGLAFKYMPVEELIEYTFENITEYKIDTFAIESQKYTDPVILKGNENRSEITDTTGYNIITTKIITRTDTAVTPKPIANIKTSIVYEKNVREDFNLTMQYTTEVFPILPIIFFEENTSELSPKYRRSINPDFTLDKMEPELMYIQDNLINILAYKLKENPELTATLKGYSDKATENCNCDLANNRAMSIKKAITDNWDIEESRIKIIRGTNNCCPSDLTQSENEQGYQDNRRVEISASDYSLLEPINKKNFMTPQMPLIRHDPKGSSKNISKWTINIRQGDMEVYGKSGTGTPPILEHKLPNRVARKLNPGEPLEIMFTVTDKYQNSTTYIEKVEFRQDTANYEIQRLSMTLFRVDDFKLSSRGKKQLRNFFSNYKPGSEIKITGYTDLLGEKEHNRALSLNRAKEVEKEIRKIVPDANIISVKGVADDEFPQGINSYNSAIERSLSRTVQIEIRVKIK